MRGVNSTKAKFIKAVDKVSVDYGKFKGSNKFVPADEAAMACLLRTDVIKKSFNVYATVETKGQYTKGQVVVDWNGQLEKPANVTIVTEMDQTLYEELMGRALL